MKLVINYDFFDKIKDVREPLNPLKVIRNNKGPMAIHFPVCMSINLMRHSLPEAIAIYGFDVLLGLSVWWLIDTWRNNSKDPYAKDAAKKLKVLASELRNQKVLTDYDLLLKSELYKTEHKITLNEKRLPFITETKYIIVPTCNSLGEVKTTSIKQEHVVGSKEYVLSHGSYTKQLKLVYANR